MFRCRLIRTVVNFSLIVAMMNQPGMLLVFAKDCGAACSSGFLCDGCGCCEVISPTEKCCCCGGGEMDGRRSCCTGTSESAEEEMVLKELEPSETLELQVIVISTTDTDEADSERSREVTSTCHCGMEGQPISHSSPTRPTVERRGSVAICFADLETIFGDAVPNTPRRLRFGSSNSPAHFSQVHLGVWRL